MMRMMLEWVLTATTKKYRSLMKLAMITTTSRTKIILPRSGSMGDGWAV